MTTIAELVERASRRFAKRTAVVDGDRRLSFAEVGDRSSRLANALGALSPRSGSRAAILMGNRLEFVEIDFAIARAGKVKVPINPRLTDAERRYMLSNCGAEVLFTERSERERVESIRSELPDLEHVVVVDEPDSYGDLLASASALRPSVAIEPDDPSMILHTSGTTGRPKGATTSQRARVSSALQHAARRVQRRRTRRHGARRPDVARVRIEDPRLLHRAVPGTSPSPSSIQARFSKRCRRSGGTSTFVVPTMIRMLLDSPHCTPASVAGIRNITYGGAPMPVALAEEAMSVFGPVLTQVYGSCEAPHPVTVLSQKEHAAEGHAQLGSSGFPTTGVQIRIVDKQGQDVSAGEPGELWIRGSNVMSGYWRDPDATGQVFTDGWYRSGDVVQLSESGLMTIVGRERDMLISGGLNVYPAEVEAVLHRHQGISEAAVFGVPDALWGEVVTAAIVTREGSTASEADILRHCTGSLAAYKLPRRIIFVDALPKGSTGKVSKVELAEMATRGRG